MAAMHGFFAFAIRFALLINVWYDQHVFFRRYGMQDVYTIFLNVTLFFTALFYVYPLKFIFSLLIVKHGFDAAVGTVHHGQNPHDLAGSLQFL